MTAIQNQASVLSHYRRIKEKFTDAMVLLQVGDFYEAFEEDAILTSIFAHTILLKDEQTDIICTGFPSHRLQQAMEKMAKAGHCIVITAVPQP